MATATPEVVGAIREVMPATEQICGNSQTPRSKTLMYPKALWSVFGIALTWIGAVGFSCSSIGYWREAVANGFTGLAIAKALTSTFLAIMAWVAIGILHSRRRRGD